MIVVHALEDPPKTFFKSIFLAGPTPRVPGVPSWRPEALERLEAVGYDGVVFYPEPHEGEAFSDKYPVQPEWEEKCLHMSDCILFWLPRSLLTLPGFTTNDEWGHWKDSGKVVFGSPPGAPKVRYQRYYAEKLHVPLAEDMSELVDHALQTVGKGAKRTDGERNVPIGIWQTDSFQRWYGQLVSNGNRLESARQVWTFRVGPKRKFLFLWALHVDIYIAAEGRHKTNEFVLSRPDISTVVMYLPSEKLEDTLVALVREFRSPVRNPRGFVYEAPGGSSFKPGVAPTRLAAIEVYEETGLTLEPSRFIRHEHRQMVATLSAHHSHLFSVELTELEVDWLRSRVGIANGVEGDSERTYVEVLPLGEILSNPNADWATIGMILSCLPEVHS